MCNRTFRSLFGLIVIFIGLFIFAVSVPAGAGTYTDRDGAAHRWSIGAAHELIWEGQPYVPFGVVFEPKSFAEGAGEDSLAADKAAIEAMKAAGVTDVIIKPGSQGIVSVPVETFQSVVDSMESAGLNYGVDLYTPSYSPLTGYVIDPAVNRLPGVKTTGSYSHKSPGTKMAVYVLCDAATAEVSKTGQALGVGGELSVQVSLRSSGNYILLFYPQKVITEAHPDWGLPDLWGGYERRRDQLLVYLPKVKFGRGLRFFTDPLAGGLGIRGETDALIPNSAAFRLEYAAWLSSRYESPRVLNLAWGVTDQNIDSFAQAARVIPLWRNGRGVAYLYDDADGSKHQVNVAASKIWLDFVEFRTQSVRSYMAAMAEALKRATSDVPVLYTAGDLQPIFQAQGASGIDGLVAPAGENMSAAAESAGRVFSLAQGSSRRTWVVSRVKPFGDTFGRKEDLFSAINAYRVLGSKGFFVEPKLTGQDSMVWLSEYAGICRRDKYLASYQPQIMYYPQNAANMRIKQLPGGAWWLPVLTPGRTLDFGPTLSGYMIRNAGTGEEDLCIWSASGTRKLSVFLTRPMIMIGASGEATELKPRKGRIELNIGTEPVILRGPEIGAFMPIEIAGEALQAFEQAYAKLERTTFEGILVYRQNLDQARKMYKGNQASVVFDISRQRTAEINAILPTLSERRETGADLVGN